MGIIDINCYQEGYSSGFEDAMKGKRMNYIGFPKTKGMISSHCYETYVEGYKKGYSDGLAKKNDVYR
jgi:hypothetical protein